MKAIFDRVVNTKYNELEAYAKFICDIAKNNRSAISAINNAYLKAINHDVRDEDEAKYTLFHYIKCELLYTRTVTDKESVKALDIYVIEDVADTEYEETNYSDILIKEVSRLNFIDKAFFNKYLDFKHEKKTVKELAEHYGIEYLYACKLVSKLKSKLKDAKINN